MIEKALEKYLLDLDAQQAQDQAEKRARVDALLVDIHRRSRATRQLALEDLYDTETGLPA